MGAIYSHGDQDPIDFQNTSTTLTLKAGDVALVGGRPCPVISQIPPLTLGAVATSGVWKFPKTNAAIALGAMVTWGPLDSPVNGVPTSGAASTGVAASGKGILGFCAEKAALATDEMVTVKVTIDAASESGGALLTAEDEEDPTGRGRGVPADKEAVEKDEDDKTVPFHKRASAEKLKDEHADKPADKPGDKPADKPGGPGHHRPAHEPAPSHGPVHNPSPGPSHSGPIGVMGTPKR